MKTLSNSIILLICLISTANTYGQIGFSMGQSSDNKFTQSEPAKFIATFPESDTTKNSYLINAYLSLDISLPKKYSISINGELQRNNLIKKEQNVEQLGIRVSKPFVLIKGVNGIQTVEKLILVTEFSGKYSNDKVKKKEGAQFIFSSSFSVPVAFDNKGEKWINLFRPNVIWPSDDIDTITNKSKGVSKWIQIRHVHNIGIEDIRYESLTMGNLTFGLELYPFSGLIYNLSKKYSILQLKWNYVYRFDISNSKSLLYVGPLYTLGAAFNFKFDKDGNNSFSVGYEYLNGGNPMKGLDDQIYGQFTINAKINIK